MPNKEFALHIYIPSYFDEVSNQEDVWNIKIGKLNGEEKSPESTRLVFEKGEIILQKDKFLLGAAEISIPQVIKKSSALTVNRLHNKVEIKPNIKWITGFQGYIFRDLTDVATHKLESRRVLVFVLGALSLFVLFSAIILRSKYSERKKMTLLTFIFVPPLLLSFIWYRRNSINYYVSQAEVDALYRLSILPLGRVLVYDKECLGCVWQTAEKPAVFANKRRYAQILAKRQISKNLRVFEAKNQKEAREEFDKLDVKYIYLVKYGDYIEKMPFSPGDLNIEKIYENANAAIWKVKN